MPRTTKPDTAKRTWAKKPNQMLIFAPNTCPHPQEEHHKDRWLLADSWTILAIGFSADDMQEARETLKRKH